MWDIMDTVGSDLKADLFSLLYIQPLINFPKISLSLILVLALKKQHFHFDQKNVFF
jgi:hypothetical protein